VNIFQYCARRKRTFVCCVEERYKQDACAPFQGGGDEFWIESRRGATLPYAFGR
jgi:hypothetical protein